GRGFSQRSFDSQPVRRDNGDREDAKWVFDLKLGAYTCFICAERKTGAAKIRVNTVTKQFYALDWVGGEM
ncbi:hypothetical protein NECAME_19166, partial [Necator americanus]